MSSHKHTGHCNCCSLSRRCFIATSAASLGASAPVLSAKERTHLEEYIDLASFQPRPKVRIKGVIVRHKPPYWLGWPGTSYDVEGHRRRYTRLFDDLARRVGVSLEWQKKPVENARAVDRVVARLRSQKPDAVFVTLQHLSVWRWVRAIADAGFPTIVFAPVGTAFTGHVRDFSRRPGVHVISSLETSAVEQAFRMIRAKQQFAATRLLVVRGNKRTETVMERLGIKVRYIPRNSLHELFHRMPVTDEVRDGR